MRTTWCCTSHLARKGLGQSSAAYLLFAVDSLTQTLERKDVYNYARETQ